VHCQATQPRPRTVEPSRSLPPQTLRPQISPGEKRAFAAMAAAGGTSSDDVPVIQAENLTSNVRSILYSRTFLSIISGVVAGIWGFTGLTGFVFYFLIMLVASIGLLAKSKFSVHTYFDSWSRILVEGVLAGLMSFVLFWTFAYDIVHIF
uniref:ER membrane protein complex subunit 6 n=2 Tax=Aegilops tauschii subsp. strangulata TaxID=200361 RepID=A0A452ZU50_AEGTS